MTRQGTARDLGLISVVVPTYMQAQYLPITLDQIMHQEYDNLEIIVIDDCSPDNTAEVLREYLTHVKTDFVSHVAGYSLHGEGFELIRHHHHRYPQNRVLRTIRNRTNLGLTASLNIAMREARGEFITYIPSDDIPHPAMLSRLASALTENNVDFVYSDMLIIDDSGRILRKFALPDFDFEKSLCNWYLLGVSKLFRRSLLDRFGYFDEQFKVSNDHELFLRFAMNGARFLHVPEVLYSVRFHGPDRRTGQHSPQSEMLMYAESVQLCERAREFMRSKQGVNIK